MLDQPLVWTPAAVKAELARVRTVLDTINQDVSAATGAKKITGDEWNQWRAFYVAAHKFVDEASTMWGSNALQARDYEQQAGKWRELVKSRGGPTSGPGDLVRKPTTSWDTTALVTVLVLGYIAWKVLDK